MCLKVISLSEESHFDDSAAERYGGSGCLYSIRSPRNPETGAVNETCVDVLQKIQCRQWALWLRRPGR